MFDLSALRDMDLNVEAIIGFFGAEKVIEAIGKEEVIKIFWASK